MKIKVVKQIRNFNDGYDDVQSVSYKTLSFDYCCSELKNHKHIDLLHEEIDKCRNCYPGPDGCNECSYEYESGKVLGMMFIYDDTYPEPWEDYYTTDTDYTILSYCPFCGEKIEVEVVKEINITDEYNNLEEKSEAAYKKWIKCNSVKRRATLENEYRELSNKLYGMERLSEYVENC